MGSILKDWTLVAGVEGQWIQEHKAYQQVTSQQCVVLFVTAMYFTCAT